MPPLRLRTGGLLAVVAALALLAPTLVPATAPTVVAPTPAAAASIRPYGVGGAWRLIFWDGFSGSSLKTNNWRPNWIGPNDRAITKPINTAELSCYDPRNVSVAGGTLRLKAEKRTCRANNGRTYRYASGIVESSHDFQFSYGYAEAKIYLKPSPGGKARRGSCGPNWPAFWLNGENWRTAGEIDVMECLGDGVSWHYHWGTGTHRQAGGYPRGWQGDMPGSSGWHRFGVDWQPGRVTFYYDGRRVGSHATGVTGKPHYLILNLGVSAPHTVNQTMYVDYVRVWKRA